MKEQLLFMRLFAKHARLWQVLLVGFGAFAGLLLLWLPVQIYSDITGALNTQKDLIGNQYLVINKGVSMLNTIGLGSGFTEADMEKLRANKAVKDFSAFTPNRFRAAASAMIKDSIGVYTEMFFEAVPDRFLDQKPEDWHWDPRSAYVPIIVPAEYLDLYNFDFAPSQGLPQISRETAKLFPFTVEVRDNRDSVYKYKGHIAAFTERINSILVPQSFVDYNNEHFSIKPAGNPNKLIVEITDAASFSKFIDSAGYSANGEYLRSGKVQSLSWKVVQVILLLAIIVIFVSLGSFLLFSNLLVARSEYEVKTLLMLGYPPGFITRKMVSALSFLLITALLSALVIGLIARVFILRFMQSIIEQPSLLPDAKAIGLLLLTGGLYLLLNWWIIRQQHRKIASPAA